MGWFRDMFSKGGKKTVRVPQGMAKGRRHMPETMAYGDKMKDAGDKIVDTGGRMVSREKRKERRGHKEARIEELEAQLAACQEEKGCPPCEAGPAHPHGGPPGQAHPHGGPPGHAKGFKKKKKKRKWGFRGYGNNPYFSGWNI